ncbi:mobilization protein [Elizabethkingia anophelis]|uniref:plasmid mobilization protein n=1 Tax=Elizabethkingia anophelis TaxID=1117645 RepID=UPI0038919CA7|nr:mobilization protein [Elizabethkingia anophelis]MCT4146109.1 mobilization protein [Elizabethkingia anophelis]
MKNQFIKLRVTRLEKLQIEKRAKSTGNSVSEFIRLLALGYEIKSKLNEKEIECYQNLSKFSDNFRRISNLFKAGDVTGMKAETLEASRLIRTHLEKLKK